MVREAENKMHSGGRTPKKAGLSLIEERKKKLGMGEEPNKIKLKRLKNTMGRAAGMASGDQQEILTAARVRKIEKDFMDVKETYPGGGPNSLFKKKVQSRLKFKTTQHSFQADVPDLVMGDGGNGESTVDDWQNHLAGEGNGHRKRGLESGGTCSRGIKRKPSQLTAV